VIFSENSGLLDIYPSHNRHIRVCNINVVDFFGIQIFNFLLVAMCTVYGFMTRHVRSDFNETKYISFAMFTVCLIWIWIWIWLTLMFTNDYNLSSPFYQPEVNGSMFSMVVSLSGMVVILIMFSNKIWLISKREDINDSLGDSSEHELTQIQANESR